MCQKLSKFNWPEHKVILGSIFRNFKRQYWHKYSRLQDKMRRTDNNIGVIDKTIPDIMINDGTSIKWFNYCYTISPEVQFVGKNYNYVHTERMFRDMCMQKLKMLEFV